MPALPLPFLRQLRTKGAKKDRRALLAFRRSLEVPPGFEPGNEGFADLCLTTWLWHHLSLPTRNAWAMLLFGAVDEIRTRDIHLGKVALYH